MGQIKQILFDIQEEEGCSIEEAQDILNERLCSAYEKWKDTMRSGEISEDIRVPDEER